MSAISAFRVASRAGATRLVAGMRVSSLVSSIARPAVMTARLGSSRAFSVTAGRFGSGTSKQKFSLSFIWYLIRSTWLADIALAQKLQEELKYEQENLPDGPDSTPEFLKSFLEQGVWSVRVFPYFCPFRSLFLLQIEDIRGNDEVTLTRKFGDEKYVSTVMHRRAF
jgi:complement component 1 Q subcomponent-binding protein